jgi:ATP-dependent DNA ligase
MNIKTFKYFYPEKPVLTTIDQESFEQMSADPDYVAELKYNGQRCCLWVIDGKVNFWGRHGKPLKYNDDPNPKIVEYMSKKFPKGVFLFDGELRHNKTVGVRDKLVLWDVLIFRDRLMNREQYWTRHAIVASRLNDNNTVFDNNFESDLGFETDRVKIIKQYPTDFQAVYDKAIKDDEIEGLVIKNLHGMLNISRVSGQNSNWMVKVRKPSGRYRF